MHVQEAEPALLILFALQGVHDNELPVPACAVFALHLQVEDLSTLVLYGGHPVHPAAALPE